MQEAERDLYQAELENIEKDLKEAQNTAVKDGALEKELE